MLKLYIY